MNQELHIFKVCIYDASCLNT